MLWTKPLLVILLVVAGVMLVMVRQRDRARRASIENYGNVAGAVPDGVAIVDARGRLVYANPALLARLGVTGPEAWRGHPVQEWIEMADASRIERRDKSAVLKLSLRHADGHRILVEANGGTFNVGGRPGLVLVVRDGPPAPRFGPLLALEMASGTTVDLRSPAPARHPSSVDITTDNLDTLTEAWEDEIETDFSFATDYEIRTEELPVVVITETVGPISDLILPPHDAHGSTRRVRTGTRPPGDANGMTGVVDSLVDLTMGDRLLTDERYRPDEAEANRADVAALAAQKSEVEEALRAAEERLQVSEARAGTAEEQARVSDDRFWSAFELAHVPQAVITLDGRYERVNLAMCTLTGYGETDLLERAVVEFSHPDESVAEAAALQRLFEGEATCRFEKRVLTADGQFVWVDQSMSLLDGQAGGPRQLLVQLQDATARRHADELFLDERRRFYGPGFIGLIGSWEYDVATATTTWSDALAELSGIDPGTWAGNFAAALEYVHPDDRAEVDLAVRDCIGNQTPFDIRCRMIRAGDGALRWLDARGAALSTEAQLERIVGSVADVTDLVLAEMSRADSEERFRLAFEAAPLGMAVIDLSEGSSALLRVNPAMCALTGRTADELCTLDLDAISDPDDAEGTRALLSDIRHGRTPTVQAEKRFRRPDGSNVWGRLRISAVPPTDRQSPQGICLVEDITARKHADEMLMLHQSLHDPLTGLANPALLHERIEQGLAAATRSEPIGVTYVDIDGFREVNDSAGRAVGDELLVTVAERLQRLVRPRDTVARVGGDEFVVLSIDGVDRNGLRAFTSGILDVMRAPFPLSTGILQITVSIGFAISGPESGAASLLHAADSSMSVAKRADRRHKGHRAAVTWHGRPGQAAARPDGIGPSKAAR